MVADAPGLVDSIVVIAPAAFGSYNPRDPKNYQRNATQFYPLLQKLRSVRVMLVFFSGDEFDPGGRAAEARKIFAEHGVPHLIVDRPRDLGHTDHRSADGTVFKNQYGACILNYISALAVPLVSSCGNE